MNPFSKTNDRAKLPDGLYAFVWRWTGRQQILLILMSVIVFPLTLVPLELQRRIINEAIESTQLQALFLLCSLYAGVVVVQAALKFCLNLYRGRVAEGVIRDLRHRVLAQDAGDTNDATGGSENNADGTAVAILSAEVEPVGNFTGDAISVPVVEMGTLVFAVGYMIVVEPLLAFVGVFLFVPQAILVPFVQRTINRRAKRRISLIREISDAITGNGSVPVSPDDLELVREKVEDVFTIRLSIFQLKFGLKAVLNLVEHFSVIGILAVGGWLAITSDTQVGTVVAFLSGLQRMRSPWRDLVAYYRGATDARVKYDLVRSSLTVDDNSR